MITLLATPKGNPQRPGRFRLVLSLIPLAIVIYLRREFPAPGRCAGDNQWYFNFEHEWLPTWASSS